MSNLTPTPGWDDVPQFETNTPVLGGPGGPMNSQAQALLNRTESLKQASDDLSSDELTKGDAKITVVQPFTGAVERTQHDKNAESISIKDFGAVGNGSTIDTAAFTAAEAAASALGINDIYLPPGTYLVASGFAFTKRYWGPGTFSYFGIGPVTFTGAGLNDFELQGTFNGPAPMTVWVEVLNTNNPNEFRFSVDGGTNWISQFVEMLPGDIEVITPYKMTTTFQPLGQTGIEMRWNAVTGHTVGNRWAFTLRPNPHILYAHSGIYMRNQRVFFADGNRNLIIGQGSGGDKCLTFERIVIGNDSGQNNQTGFGSIDIGSRAGQLCRDGSLRVNLGTWAGRDATIDSRSVNIGAYSGTKSYGGDNTNVGTDSGSFLNNGSENCNFGNQCGHGNDEVQDGGYNPVRNTLGGVQTMRDLENGSYNAIWGGFSAAIAKNVQGTAALGYNTFGALVSGDFNVGAGLGAGGSVTTGSSGIYIGHNAGNNVLQKVDAVNSIAIGANTFNTANNQVVIGNSLHTDVFFYGHIKPQTDNAQNLGAPAARFGVVHAGTGTINTSDERLKQDIGDIPDDWLDAWECVEWQRFRFKDAVADKGDGARWHIGLIAQRVQDVFEKRGIDPLAIGLLCHDEWPEEWIDARDEDGVVRRVKIRDAGDRYGIRYEEALALEAALMRREIQKLKTTR